MTRKAHVLFEGYLSDAPGRDESWTEYVTYLGSNRWLLVMEGTTFDGSESAERQVERMGTQPLIKWCLERDEENAESAASQSLLAEAEEVVEAEVEGEGETLGERAARLLDAARNENAAFCVACLEGWVAGTWPHRKRVPVPRILSITGVTKRGIWLHVYRTAFRVETTHGPGYLGKPDDNRSAKLVLQSESSMSQGRTVRIPTRLLPRIKELQPEFDALDAVRGP